MMMMMMIVIVLKQGSGWSEKSMATKGTPPTLPCPPNFSAASLIKRKKSKEQTMAEAKRRREETRLESPGVLQYSFQRVHTLCQKINVINQLINI